MKTDAAQATALAGVSKTPFTNIEQRRPQRTGSLITSPIIRHFREFLAIRELIE